MLTRLVGILWLVLLNLTTQTHALDNDDLAHGILCDVRMWGDFVTTDLSDPYESHYKPRGVVSYPLNRSEIDSQVPLLMSMVIPQNKKIDYYGDADGFSANDNQRGFHPLLTEPDDIPDYKFRCYDPSKPLPVDIDCYPMASFTRFRGMIDFEFGSCASAVFHVFSNPDDSGHLSLFKIDPTSRSVVQVPTLNDNFRPNSTGPTGPAGWAQTEGYTLLPNDVFSRKRNFHLVHFDFYVHQVGGPMGAKLQWLKECDASLIGNSLPDSSGSTVPASAFSTGARFALQDDDDAFDEDIANGNGPLIMVTDGVWPARDNPMTMSARARVEVTGQNPDDYTADSGRFFDTSSPNYTTSALSNRTKRFHYFQSNSSTLLHVETTPENPSVTFVITGRFVGEGMMRLRKANSSPIKVYTCQNSDMTHMPIRHTEHSILNLNNQGFMCEVDNFNTVDLIDTDMFQTVTIAGVLEGVNQSMTISCQMENENGTNIDTPCSHFLRHAEPVWATEQNPIGTRTWIESYYDDLSISQRLTAILSLPTRSDGFVFADGRVTLHLPPGKLEQLPTSALLRNHYFDYVVSQWRLCLHPMYAGFTATDADIERYTLSVLPELPSSEVDELVRTDLAAWNTHPWNGDVEIDLRALPESSLTWLVDGLRGADPSVQPRLRFSARAEMQLNGQGAFPFAVKDVHPFPWRTDPNTHHFTDEGVLTAPILWTSAEALSAFSVVLDTGCGQSAWCDKLLLTSSGVTSFQSILARREGAGFDGTAFEIIAFTGDCNATSVKSGPGSATQYLRLSSADIHAASGQHNLMRLNSAPGQRTCIRVVADRFFATPAIVVAPSLSTWRKVRDNSISVIAKSLDHSRPALRRPVEVSINFDLAKFSVGAHPNVNLNRVTLYFVEFDAAWPASTVHFINHTISTRTIDAPSVFAYGMSLNFTPVDWTNSIAPDGVIAPSSSDMLVLLADHPRQLLPIVGPNKNEAVTYTFGGNTSNHLIIEWADLGAIEPRLLGGTRPQLTGYRLEIGGDWTRVEFLDANVSRFEVDVPQTLFDASSALEVFLEVTVTPLSHPDVLDAFPGMPAWQPTIVNNVHLQQLRPPVIAPGYLQLENQLARHVFAARFKWQHTPVDNNILTLANPPQTHVSLWWAPPSQTLQFVKNLTVTQLPGINGQPPDETHWLFDSLPPGQYKLFLWTQAHGVDDNIRWVDRRSVVVESETVSHTALNLNLFYKSTSPTRANGYRAFTFSMGGTSASEQHILLRHIERALTPVAASDFDAAEDDSAVSFSVECFVSELPSMRFSETRTLGEIAAFGSYTIASFLNPWFGGYQCTVSCNQLTATSVQVTTVQYADEVSHLRQQVGGAPPQNLSNEMATPLEFTSVPMLPTQLTEMRLEFAQSEYSTCTPSLVTPTAQVNSRSVFDYTWQCVLPAGLGQALQPQVRHGAAFLPFADVAASLVSFLPPVVDPFSLRSISAANDTLPLQMRSNLPAQFTFSGSGFSNDPARLLTVQMRTLTDDKLWPCDVSTSQSNSTFITCLSTKGIGGRARVRVDVIPAPVGSLSQEFSRGVGDVHDVTFPFAPQPQRIYGCDGADPPVCDTKGASVMLEGLDVGSEASSQVSVTIDGVVSVAATTRNTTHIEFRLPALVDGMSRRPLLSVQRGAGIESAEIAGLFSYELPQLLSIGGCQSCDDNAICECSRAGGDLVTVTGRHFGPSSLRMLVGATVVPNVTHDAVEPTEKVTFALPAVEDSGARRALLAITPDGSFSAGTLQLSYAACPPGTQLNTGGHECTECAAGEYSYGGDQLCTPCVKGSFSQRPRSEACVLARAGFFSNDRVRELPCPSGTFSELQGMRECAECGAASFAEEDALMGSPTCEQCPVGYKANRTACVQCDWASGQTTTSDGKDCKTCQAGSFLNVSRGADLVWQASCAECPAGTYSSEAGATSCTACPMGFFSEVGSSECTACKAGSYAARNGSTSCLTCPPFTWQPSARASFCAPCLAPSALDFAGNPVAGRETCGFCAAGQYAPVVLTPDAEYPVRYTGGCRACPANVDCRHSVRVRARATSPLDQGQEQHVLLLEGVEPMVELLVGVPKAEEGFWLSVDEDGVVEALPCAGDRCLAPGECQSTAPLVELSEENVRALSVGTVSVDVDELMDLTWITMAPSSCCSENRVATDTEWASNPLCGACLPEHYEWGGNCLDCQSTRDALIGVVVVALWVFVLVFHMASQSTRSEIKIFVYFVQMSLLFFGPDAEWLQWTTALSGNVVESSGAPVCVARFSSSEKLLLNMLVPLLCFGELLLTAAVAAAYWRLRQRRRDHPTEDHLTDREDHPTDREDHPTEATRSTDDKFKTSGFIRTGMMLVIFCFNAITDTAFGFFRCVDTGGGVRVVATYTGLECHSGEWNRTLPVVLLFLVLVSIGVPCVTAFLFWRARKRRTVFTLKFLERYGVLYEHYRCGVAPVWEVVVFVRRLVLILISSMLVRDRSALYSALSVANVTALLLHLLVQPFWKQFDNVCETVSLVLLTLLTIALADTELPMSSGQEAAFATLVLMPSLLLVVFTGVRLVMVRFAASQWLSLERRSRRYLDWMKRVVLGKDSAKRLSDDTQGDENEFDFAADALSPQQLCERNFGDMLRAGASRRVALRRTLDSETSEGETFRAYLARREDHEDPSARTHESADKTVGEPEAGGVVELPRLSRRASSFESTRSPHMD